MRSILTAGNRPLQFALALGLGVGIAPPHTDTYPRQPGIDALHYAFRLTLRDDTDEIAGEATVDVRCTEAGLSGFTLDLGSGRPLVVSSRGRPPAGHPRSRLDRR